jgi:hypothetical protein
MEIKKIANYFYSTLVISIFLTGCNFPNELPATEGTKIPTTTKTLAPSVVVVTSQTPTITSTTIQLPSETPSITASSTNLIPPTPSFTPVPTFTFVPTRPSTTTGLQGQALIVKPSRTYPMAGASVTLYDNRTDDNIASTVTILDGTFRFSQVEPGKYYLVLVWVMSKVGAWPCANNKIPPAGSKTSWNYPDGNLMIYVEIRNNSEKGIIVVVSTGGFSVSGQKKVVDVTLFCNQLK